MKAINESEEIVNRLKNKYEDYLEKREKLSDLEKSVKLYESLDKQKTKFEQSIASKKEYLELQINKEENEIELEEREIKEQQDSIADLPKVIFNLVEAIKLKIRCIFVAKSYLFWEIR